MNKPIGEALSNYLEHNGSSKEGAEIFKLMKSQPFFFNILLAAYQKGHISFIVLRLFGDGYFVKRNKKIPRQRWRNELNKTLELFFEKADKTTTEDYDTTIEYPKECEAALRHLDFIINPNLANESTLFSTKLRPSVNYTSDENIKILVKFLTTLINDYENDTSTNIEKEIKDIRESNCKQAKILFKTLLNNSDIANSLLKCEKAIDIIQENVSLSRSLLEKFNEHKSKWPYLEDRYVTLFSILEPSVLVEACQRKPRKTYFGYYQAATFIPAEMLAKRILALPDKKKNSTQCIN